jgi:hypothetical protein
MPCVLLVLAGGCATGLGPKAVRSERPDYNRQIVRSNDAELLLNLVRLRYNDSMLFLGAGGVVAQYSYDVSLNPRWHGRRRHRRQRERRHGARVWREADHHLYAAHGPPGFGAPMRQSEGRICLGPVHRQGDLRGERVKKIGSRLGHRTAV